MREKERASERKTGRVGQIHIHTHVSKREREKSGEEPRARKSSWIRVDPRAGSRKRGREKNLISASSSRALIQRDLANERAYS